MKPEEFYRLHPVEFWWIFEANKPVKMYGKRHMISEAEVAELYEDAYGPPKGDD